MHDLLDPTSNIQITTKEIPKDFSGSSYSELKSYVEAMMPQNQVIGVMENTGNPYILKDRAIRDAQKTSDVRRLVSNLTSVKEIRINHPIFNPKPEHSIDRHTYIYDCY